MSETVRHSRVAPVRFDKALLARGSNRKSCPLILSRMSTRTVLLSPAKKERNQSFGELHDTDSSQMRGIN